LLVDLRTGHDEVLCIIKLEDESFDTEGRSRILDLFLERAENMIEGGFPIQKSWYSHLLELIPK